MAIISFINNEQQIKSKEYSIIQFLHMEPEKFKILTLLNQETKEEDQYALTLKPLGEGKYAKVYKATNIKDQSKIFAVKVIKIVSEEVKVDYLKELKIIKNLPKCPNIVSTYKQHLQSQNNLYIFQQYCESGTLATYRAQKLGLPFTENEIYDLFYQVTNGLIFLLQAGIIHEDIKPVNILKKGPVFKLCDFGVSQIQSEYIQTTTRRGTISYMPPQKLKIKKFIPSDKTDIYSLGVCLYQIIFGIHPYLKKKTTNYKEYLTVLEESTLLPLTLLMKKIGSTSLQLQNFLKFLEKMIDLNTKTRIGLKELKEFIANTQPFRDMKPIDQQSLQRYVADKAGLLDDRNIEDIFQSVIIFKKEEVKDNLQISSPPPKVDPMIEIRRKIRENYLREETYVVGVISLLLNSIEAIRKQNYRNLNVCPLDKNFLGIDIQQCKISRFIKYLIYQFSITIIKRFKEKYQTYLQEHIQEKLAENKAFLQRQFNKFLIQCDFENKDLLADQLKNRQNNSNLWLQIQRYYQGLINSIVVIEENRRLDLLCTIYCIYIPKILNSFHKLTSIFSDTPLEEQFKANFFDETPIASGQKILSEIIVVQKMKKEQLRVIVEQQLASLERDYLFDIGEQSGEVQIITEEDLL